MTPPAFASVLNVLADFGPGVSAVSPFLPVPILAVVLLAVMRDGPVLAPLPLGGFSVMKPRRRNCRRDPVAALAGLAIVAVISASATVSGLLSR